MKVSLIISTYNSPRALEACLHSVLVQTQRPYEVLIADDGSTDSTESVIKRFIDKANCKVTHVWQKNEGFRLATIRNKAIAQATGDYIVQIDGDILLHPDFIADHAAVAKRGHFVCGSRVLVDKELTQRIYDTPTIMPRPWSYGISNRKNAVRSPLLCSMIQLLSSSLKYRGCNMAFWRSDLLAVNGYDESYTGWGCEDHDLVARLVNHRIKPLQIRHRAICFHLWHPSSKSSDTFERNNALLEQTRRERRIRSLDGLDKYIHGKITI
ncbi:MAG: glycosyltransferase family 2 protein [Muribaculaceae bacterium]|nr:glycosyltransferase family 2 protein [Muribaculaceae bacterium]